MSKITITIKLFFFILFLQPFITHAWIVEDRCTDLDLKIQNHTQSICHLMDFKLISGYFPDTTDIPVLLFPWESSDRFRFTENSRHSTDFHSDIIHLMMQYECGENKMVTFVAQKGKCLRSRANVNAMVMSEHNMETSFALADGRMRDNTPGVIIWTFSEKRSPE